MKIIDIKNKKINIKHQTHLDSILRFLGVLVVFVLYFLYLNSKYDFKTSGMLAALTWSFFVLCTPLADAGFLVAFPLRLLIGLRMIVSEIIITFVAIALNIYFVFTNPSIYDQSILGKVFYKILTIPIPYWAILILCLIGSILSIYFGDEMIDVVKHEDRKKYNKHKTKHKIIATLAIFGLTIIIYYYLLNTFDIKLF